MAIGSIGSALPNSLAWLLQSISSRDELDVDEVARHAPRRFKDRGARFTMMVLGWRKAFGTFVPTDYEMVDQGQYVIRGRDAKERACTLSAAVELDPPFRFQRLMLVRDPPRGYSYRQATIDDYTTCAHVETQCPTVSDEGTYRLSRGAGFQTYIQLQGQTRICVIEHDHTIVGWNSASLRSVSSPDPLVFGYLAQACILAEHQSSGAYWPASAQNMAWLQEFADHNYWYLNVGNDRSKNFTEGAQFWSEPVCDISIACHTREARGVGRRAEMADAPRLADLFNAAHHQEEFFDPYTGAKLCERFSRAPNSYGFPQILLGKQAALGIWMAGEKIAHTIGGKTTHSTVANVLDYGFEGDVGLRELSDLLTTASGMAREAGMTHLSILASQPSLAYATLAEMADGIDHYTMAGLRIEPSDLGSRGLYADHIYF